MQLPDTLARLSDDRIRRFAAYWLSRRGDRPVPTRRDIDPVDIPWALPFIWICDHLAEQAGGLGDFRYRLAGEHINEAFRQNLRGKTMRDVVSPEIHAIAIRRYTLVIEPPSVLHNIGPVYNHRGGLVTGERVVFPLSSTGECIDMIVGLTVSERDRCREGQVDGNGALQNAYIPMSSFGAD